MVLPFTLVASIAIFILDWFTPVMLATWGLYVLVILLVNRWGEAKLLYPTLVLCTLLTIAGLLGPLRHPDTAMIALNRLLGISAMWVLGYYLIEHRKSSAILHRSLTRYTALFETAPVGISIVDLAGNIVETNQQAESILGVSKREHETRTLDAPIWKIIRPDGSPMPASEYASVRALREQQRVDNVEMGVIRTDGSVSWLSVTAAPIAKAQEGAVIVYTDITERVRSEQALAQLAAIVQTSEDAILSNDLSGTIASWNRSASQLYGYQESEAIGQAAAMLFPPESGGEMADILARIQQGELFSRYQTEHVDRAGKRMVMSLAISPVYDRNGRIMGTSMIARDVTEQNELQQRVHRLNCELEQHVQERTAALMAALDEARQADQIKEAFLSAVSHELRTPLTGVLSVADALELETSGPLNERQQELVELLRRSSVRLLEMINGILHYTKLLAGETTLRSDVCRLADLGARGIGKVQPQADRKQLCISSVTEPPDLEIVGDAEGIVQLIFNLLDNAVKFTPAGGALGLEIRRTEDDEVEISVWDTGIGIAEEQQSHIFDAFIQADSGRKRQYEGVGLGLAYAQRMAHLLGGECTVQSRPGGGSRFTVRLPSDVRRQVRSVEQFVKPNG